MFRGRLSECNFQNKKSSIGYSLASLLSSSAVILPGKTDLIYWSDMEYSELIGRIAAELRSYGKKFSFERPDELGC
jgi:hypothetical protein